MTTDNANASRISKSFSAKPKGGRQVIGKNKYRPVPEVKRIRTKTDIGQWTEGQGFECQRFCFKGRIQQEHRTKTRRNGRQAGEIHTFTVEENRNGDEGDTKKPQRIIDP